MHLPGIAFPSAAARARTRLDRWPWPRSHIFPASTPDKGASDFRRFFPPATQKEVLVGMLFAAGCFVPAWSRLPVATTSEASMWLLWIPGVYFAMLVWLNCWCIAGWEAAVAHGASPQTSRCAHRAPIATVSAAGLLALVGLLLAVLAPASAMRSGALLSAGAICALMLGLLDCLRLRLTPLALRAAADLVMLTPLFLLVR